MTTRTILTVLLAAISLPAFAKPAPRAPVPLGEYFQIRRVSGGSFSGDEGTVAYAFDGGGRPDIWVQPTAGGQAVQLTHVSGFIDSFNFAPTGDRLVYEADIGGDELPHLFLTDSKGTAPRDLTAAYPKGRRTEFVRWSEDGQRFLYLSNLRDEKYLDLYEWDLAKDQPEKLWQASGKLGFSVASRDHRRFIVTETLSDADSNLYLIARGKDQPQLLTQHQGEALFQASDLSPDGKTLYYTTTLGGEFAELRAMELGTLASRSVEKAKWDVEAAGFSRTGKYFYSLTNVDGSFKLKLTDANSGKAVALPAPPKGAGWVPVDFSPKDHYLGVRVQGDGMPTTLWIIDLEKHSARPVIDPLPPSLKDRPMVVGESVRISSFDGRKVPAYLYKPQGSGPFSAIIDVHGGPTAQSRREYNRMRQYLVSKGYVVLVPNVRGSTGYGKSYTKLDNLDLGGGPLKDVVACKKWLVTHAAVDAARVVVQGGSYGGYMALAAAAFTPTEFAASVDYFGVSDLKSLVESFPPYWTNAATSIYQKFGDPKNPQHAQYQHDRSPANYVDKIVRPLLVVQGDKDARVKKDQSDRIVLQLEQRKVPVHYLVLKNEGHGFSRNESFLAAFQATDRFLDRYLFGDTTVDVLLK